MSKQEEALEAAEHCYEALKFASLHQQSYFESLMYFNLFKWAGYAERNAIKKNLKPKE